MSRRISRRAMRSGVSSLRALIGNVTEPPGHISRMRRYDGMFRLPGAFSRHEFSADYTISMFGFDFPTGTGVKIDGGALKAPRAA
jgi:hypothetical protein